MKINLSVFDLLVDARERMGADLCIAESAQRGYTSAVDWPEAGEIELTSTDIKIGSDEKILVRNQHAIIYIQDTGHDRATLENNPETSKKYHFYQCRTIEQMISRGRFERYVATIRRDGWFKVHSKEFSGMREELEARLSPCRNCLAKAGFQGQPSSFNIDEYLETSPQPSDGRRLPSTRDSDGRLSGYSHDWNRVSSEVRRKANYSCQHCGVDLSDHRHLLDTHHLSGVKSNTDPNDLVALCKICHSEQPGHGHMSVPDQDARLIRRQREG